MKLRRCSTQYHHLRSYLLFPYLCQENQLRLQQNLDRQRNNNEGENTLLQRIADDPEIPLNFDELKSAIATSDIGRTDQQIEAVNQVIQQVIERHPESKSYKPQTII